MQALAEAPVQESSGPSAPPLAIDVGALSLGREMPVGGEALEAAMASCFIPEDRVGTVRDVVYMHETRSFFLFLIDGQGTCE